MSSEYLSVDTDDPIELCIIAKLNEIKKQNVRLKSYIEKSGYWAELKEVCEWKPFDFLHYFCNQYQKKYKKEYRVLGNIVKAYQKIEGFVKQYGITNQDYKQFVDTSFSRYFSDAFVPSLGTICSATFYTKVTNKRISYTVDTDPTMIESKMHREVTEFDDCVALEEANDIADLRRKICLEEEQLLSD